MFINRVNTVQYPAVLQNAHNFIFPYIYIFIATYWIFLYGTKTVLALQTSSMEKFTSKLYRKMWGRQDIILNKTVLVPYRKIQYVAIETPFFIIIILIIQVLLILSSGFPSHKNWYKMSYISVKTWAEVFDSIVKICTKTGRANVLITVIRTIMKKGVSIATYWIFLYGTENV
jgi:hypothetical protein